MCSLQSSILQSKVHNSSKYQDVQTQLHKMHKMLLGITDHTTKKWSKLWVLKNNNNNQIIGNSWH